MREQLEELKADGFESIAVVLMHSYGYRDHEYQIKDIAVELGFK